jgi:hypothetical protein
MARMAQACLIDPKPIAERVPGGFNVGAYDSQEPSSWSAMWIRLFTVLPDADLLWAWNQVAEAMAGGVQTASDQIEGDPFAFFLTGICQQHHEGTSINAEGVEEHEGRLWYKQTAVIKTGKRVDQAEAEKMLAYLKAEPNINTCEICKEPITCWSSEVTRVSTFRA